MCVEQASLPAPVGQGRLSHLDGGDPTGYLVRPPFPTKGSDVSEYKNRIRIRSLSELVALEPPSWLITEYLPNKSLITLYGTPGCGKSFLALDLGLSIAMGEPWLEREVDQGGVIYIACEAIAGMPRRVDAWIKHRGLTIPDMTKVPFHFTTEFNDLRTPTSTADFLRAVTHDIPGQTVKLVILDTLSRTLGAADENSAGEMNNALNHLEMIRAQMGCAIIVIHHTAKHTQQERGSTVLRGACDTMLFLKSDGGVGGLKLEMTKQRDWEEAAAQNLFFCKTGDSAVLTSKMPEGSMVVSPKEMDTVSVLEELYLGNPVSYATWKNAFETLSESTFRRRVKILTANGLVVKAPGARGGYIPASALGR